MRTLPRTRVRLLAIGVSVTLAAILSGTALATAPPVGALPAGPTSMIHTQPGQLVAVALPHRAGGKVWRVAGRLDGSKLRQVSEADVGSSVVLVFKALAVGNATVSFGLTRGERPKAYESRQYVVMIMPGIDSAPRSIEARSRMREFDVVVLGAGAAGEVTAGRLGRHGLSVAIVEQALVGGECSYFACMPSKALLRPIDLAREVPRVPGLSVGPIDVAAVLARRDEVIRNLDDAGQLPWLEQHGVTLVRGRGTLQGERRVQVGGETLSARRAVVVATGSTPTIPDIPGLRATRPWTNVEATTARHVPARLAILGGGVVGVELSQVYAGLGAQVTLVHRGERLIGREEPFAGEQVLASLGEAGVDVRLQTSATRISRAATVLLELDDGSILEADEVLAAFGRTPGTRDIGLAGLGLSEDEPLVVGDDLRVPGHEWLYAVGDVNGRVQLTHMGKYQGRLVADAIAGRAVRLRSDGRSSPRVIFTDPQVAAVGLTLATARDAGIDVRAVDVDTGGNAGGSFVGRGAAGTARMLVDEQRRVLVGFTVTGPEVAEMLHAATIAVVSGTSIDDLWHAVPSFPTRSELWLKLLEAYGL